VVRVLAPGDLGHVHGQRAHAFDVGDDLGCAEHRTQVPGHRLLQRQQGERLLLDPLAHRHERGVVGDHPFGGREVGIQQGMGGALHRLPGQAAHLAQLRCQIGQLLVVCRSHR
jgi:hypothetical protein